MELTIALRGVLLIKIASGRLQYHVGDYSASLIGFRS